MVGYAEGAGEPDPAMEGVILADIATAQEALGRVGWLDRIDLVLGREPGAEAAVRALLPEGNHAGPFFEACGNSLQARSIGGDFFDYQARPHDRFGFALGDVTGKGPPAALLTAMVQGALAAHADSEAGPHDLVALLQQERAGNGARYATGDQDCAHAKVDIAAAPLGERT